MQGIIMQIFNGCFNSHVLALSQAYVAAVGIKIHAFMCEGIIVHTLFFIILGLRITLLLLLFMYGASKSGY